MKDGGPAFPQPSLPVRFEDQGMSLRDYFATAALNKLMAWDFSAPYDEKGFLRYTDHAAKTAYAFADAMLAEREKQDPDSLTLRNYPFLKQRENSEKQ